MASTNKTTNYNLSQYIGSDKPTYLGDYNSDMLKIDTAIKNVSDANTATDAKADIAKETADTALSAGTSAGETATSANQTANNALAKALSNESKIGIITSYSTTEQVIGTWINGKPLYKKVIDLGQMPNAGTKQVNLDINNLDQVVHFNGFAQSDNAIYPLPYNTSSGSNQISIAIDKSINKINIFTSSDRSGFNGYMSLEYTKTTD